MGKTFHCKSILTVHDGRSLVILVQKSSGTFDPLLTMAHLRKWPIYEPPDDTFVGVVKYPLFTS